MQHPDAARRIFDKQMKAPGKNKTQNLWHWLCRVGAFALLTGPNFACASDTDYFPLAIGQIDLYHMAAKLPPYLAADGIDVKRIQKVSVDETVEQQAGVYQVDQAGDHDPGDRAHRARPDPAMDGEQKG